MSRKPAASTPGASGPPSRRACPVCAANRAEGFNARYLRCPDCGALYYFEMPSAELLAEVYGGGLLKRLRRKLLAPFRKIHHRPRLAYERERAAAIHARVRALAGDRAEARYLDIGCNRGFLLEAARRDGWDVWGVEFSKEQIQPFRNSYPELTAQVLDGDFGELASRLPEGSFDVVSAIDVVEHFLDPRPCFVAIFRLMAPGGRLVIQTPSSELEDARRDGPAWGELKPGEHMQIFTPGNLEAMTRELGFSGLELAETPFDHPRCNFVAVLRKD